MIEIMQNSRDHVSCVQHLEVTYVLKKLKILQFENSNDAYYRCLWLQLVNKVKMEQIILFMKIANR